MTISGGYLKDHALGAKGMIQDFTNGEKPGPWDVVVVQGYSRGPLTQEIAPPFESMGERSTAGSAMRDCRPCSS